MFSFFSFYFSFNFFFNFFFKIFNFSNIFKNNYFYLNFYKNWYNKNLFLKKKSSISEINYSSFLRFYHKSKDSYFLADNNIVKSSNITLNSSDFDLYETQKDSILELKKNFLSLVKQNRHLLSFFFLKKQKDKKLLQNNFIILKQKNNCVLLSWTYFFCF